jgi:hypothetical protein
MGLTYSKVHMDNKRVRRKIHFHENLQSEGMNIFGTSKWYTQGWDIHRIFGGLVIKKSSFATEIPWEMCESWIIVPQIVKL